MGFSNKFAPFFVRASVATFFNKCGVFQPFIDDDMRQRIQHRHIGAGAKLEVILRSYMGRIDDIYFTRVNHNQLCAIAQAPFQLGRKHGVTIGGIGTNHNHHIGFLHRLKRLGAR